MEPALRCSESAFVCCLPTFQPLLFFTFTILPNLGQAYEFENSQFILLKCVSILFCVVFRLVYPHILFLQQNNKITILLIFKNYSSFLAFQEPIAKCLHNCMGWEPLLCTLRIDYKGGIWCVLLAFSKEINTADLVKVYFWTQLG